jgi:hypothetical protein
MERIVKHLLPNAGTLVIVGLLLLAQSAGALPSAAPAKPLAPSQTVLSYQGTLTDPGGTPVNETVTMEFALYDAATLGNLKWGPETQGVVVSEGLFHVLLGSATPIDQAILTGNLYLEIKVGGETLTPRELLASVVYALEAGTLPHGATTQGTLNLGGNLDLQSYAVKGVSELQSADNGTDLVVDNSYRNVRVRSANSMFLFIDQDNDTSDAIFRIVKDNDHMEYPAKGIFQVAEDGVITAYGDLNMNGHTVSNCGALTEANLQTEEELAAERIDRFEEGDVLCWGVDRLEKCFTANDRLVQAVADSSGRPIVMGAEPVKVVGPVQRGDVLVASEVPGYAMVNNDPVPGTVIAQALEDFKGKRGIIKAMIRKW